MARLRISCTANISNEIFSLSVPTYAYQFDDENAATPELPPASFPYSNFWIGVLEQSVLASVATEPTSAGIV